MNNRDNAVRMTAKELEMRFTSEARFRLRAMPYVRSSQPPRVGGRWQLITSVDYAPGTPPLLYSTEAEPSEAYPSDVVIVIPEHPLCADDALDALESGGSFAAVSRASQTAGNGRWVRSGWSAPFRGRGDRIEAGRGV